ncbi:hypothetical protein [Cupriavidus sp. RAF20_2]|uniref:hypothetical protein n=1 Tax=Cupriavidus sp. RAF20_2 TaxID=3233053 RepID=UPI003F8EBD5C
MTKERPILFSGAMVRAILDGRKTQTRRPVKGWALDWLQSDKFTPEYVADRANRACPYGQAGDRLWVRETHGYGGDAYAPDLYYRATHPDAPIQGRWHPSLHMRREDSRLVLEITGVRVERLNECSDADAVAEGLHVLPASGRYVVSPGEQYAGLADHDPRAVYADLWDRINGAGAWEANPWVWVVEFRKV